MEVLTRPSPVSDAPCSELVSLVQRYCSLIESSTRGRLHWLPEVAVLLPRLHALIAPLSAAGLGAGHVPPVDLDARFELFSHLRRLLADRDAYWLEFDLASEGDEAMSGSLADDLTDIYCELKAGLCAYDEDPEWALAAWCAGYELHWSRHLLDAERHLSMLIADGRL
ncbi:hypothetical protein MARPU_01285 [Marichromatium purpuratum 984]|uniref:DUF5063 domain-containing protein n=1 Tax=Marichromatium purpuratum 984 TaxID=765910 RepID=W0E081_MARPU|nr:DUF5063 domain-containing protein [Marichromatium purpuratum]AHF02644.1 hypothetical protein MARPU_01285 [Marichromatium purpuratum 984]